jgi:hypothetical protein
MIVQSHTELNLDFFPLILIGQSLSYPDDGLESVLHPHDSMNSWMLCSLVMRLFGDTALRDILYED